METKAANFKNISIFDFENIRNMETVIDVEALMEVSKFIKFNRKRIEKLDGSTNEQASKLYLVLPTLKALKYNIHSFHVVPEVNCGMYGGKDAKVDYGLTDDNGEYVVLVECKPLGSKLSNKTWLRKLAQYFSSKNAKIAILTDGNWYWFFTNSVKANIMDEEPYLKLCIEDLTEDTIKQLNYYARPNILNHANTVVTSIIETDEFKSKVEAESTEYDAWLKNLWTTFIDCCNQNGCSHLAKNEPKAQTWYDLCIGTEFSIALEVFGKRVLALTIYSNTHSNSNCLYRIMDNSDSLFKFKLPIITDAYCIGTSACRLVEYFIESTGKLDECTFKRAIMLYNKICESIDWNKFIKEDRFNGVIGQQGLGTSGFDFMLDTDRFSKRNHFNKSVFIYDNDYSYAEAYKLLVKMVNSLKVIKNIPSEVLTELRFNGEQFIFTQCHPDSDLDTATGLYIKRFDLQDTCTIIKYLLNTFKLKENYLLIYNKYDTYHDFNIMNYSADRIESASIKLTVPARFNRSNLYRDVESILLDDTVKNEDGTNALKVYDSSSDTYTYLNVKAEIKASYPEKFGKTWPEISCTDKNGTYHKLEISVYSKEDTEKCIKLTRTYTEQAYNNFQQTNGDKHWVQVITSDAGRRLGISKVLTCLYFSKVQFMDQSGTVYTNTSSLDDMFFKRVILNGKPESLDEIYTKLCNGELKLI